MSSANSVRSRQRGLTLMEVLVALVVLSIGLLGIAGMQLTALRANTAAYRQTQATWYAYDMGDRIRANRKGVEDDNYNAMDTASASDPGCIADTDGCTPDEVAATDLYEWSRLLAALPGGKGTVTGDGEEFVVTVMWDDLGTGGADCTTLNCLTIGVRP